MEKLTSLYIFNCFSVKNKDPTTLDASTGRLMIIECLYVKKSRSPELVFSHFKVAFLEINFCATSLVFAFRVTYIYIYIYIYIHVYFINNIYKYIYM